MLLYPYQIGTITEYLKFLIKTPLLTKQTEKTITSSSRRHFQPGKCICSRLDLSDMVITKVDDCQLRVLKVTTPLQVSPPVSQCK